MQIGSRAALDAARHTLRDQFDAIWLASDKIEATEARAIRCAIALSHPDTHHLSPNWTLFRGGRLCGSHNRVILA